MKITLSKVVTVLLIALSVVAAYFSFEFFRTFYDIYWGNFAANGFGRLIFLFGGWIFAILGVFCAWVFIVSFMVSIIEIKAHIEKKYK